MSVLCRTVPALVLLWAAMNSWGAMTAMAASPAESCAAVFGPSVQNSEFANQILPAVGRGEMVLLPHADGSFESALVVDIPKPGSLGILRLNGQVGIAVEHISDVGVGRKVGLFYGMRPDSMAVLALDAGGFEFVAFEGIFPEGKVGVKSGARQYQTDASILGYFVAEVSGFKKNEEVMIKSGESKIRARVVAYFPVLKKIGVQYWSETTQDWLPLGKGNTALVESQYIEKP